ncbi:hypothetical protein GCM10009809_07880 [Isoptericola hypogeus]|uniref:DUF3017 domain-containing protein n=1 Tax=Isoptericola hypogeus TaxID=300179 RepID=A0ABN2IY05_9MICO
MDPRAQPDPAGGRPEPAPVWHSVDRSDEGAPASGRRVPGPERAIVTVLVGVVLAVVLGVLVGARLGTLTVAVTLAVAGTWRATSPSGPMGLVVRSRGFDVLTCWTAAVAIGVLALTAPGVG